MDALKFEVGKTYRIFGMGTNGRFKAKCVSRTAKTATFEADENGAAWYMPDFTLRAGKWNLKLHFDDLPIEAFVSNKRTNRFPYGVLAYGSYAID